MKQRHFLSLLALVVSVAFIVGCSIGSSPDYVGTWVATDGIGPGTGTFTWTITTTTMHFAIAGGTAGVGTADASLVVDESAKHMTMTITSSTGAFIAFFVPPEVFYTTYAVTGNTLQVANPVASLPFPPDATGGLTLTKQ